MLVFNYSQCSFCGKCSNVCPVKAITIDKQVKKRIHDFKRCIGCGLCAAACKTENAISMKPRTGYFTPAKGLLSILFKDGTSYLMNALHGWYKRRKYPKVHIL